MKILRVIAQPRPTSLTHAAKAFADAASAKGHQIEWADFAAEHFDASLGPADEPDWGDARKTCFPAVQAEMARILRNEATGMVFPVWWWSVPALLKGWIDRVRTNGRAYGDVKYPHQKAWMIGVTGSNAASFAKRGYDKALQMQLKTEFLDCCGFKDTALHLLFGSVKAEAQAALLAECTRLGAAFWRQARPHKPKAPPGCTAPEGQTPRASSRRMGDTPIPPSDQNPALIFSNSLTIRSRSAGSSGVCASIVPATGSTKAAFRTSGAIFDIDTVLVDA